MLNNPDSRPAPLFPPRLLRPGRRIAWSPTPRRVWTGLFVGVRLSGIALFAASLLVGSLASRAASITWTNTGGGNWNVPANWSPNQVPGAADTALVTTPGTYAVTLNVSVTLSNLSLGGAASGVQTLQANTFNLTATNALINSGGILSLTNSKLTGAIGVTDGAVLSVNGVVVEAQVTVESGGQMLPAGSSSSIGQNGYAGNTNCWLWLQSGAQMSAASSAYLYLWSPMTNSGTCYMTNEGFYVYNNNTAGQDGGLVNLAGGVINLISAAGIMGESGFDYLVNQGTINVSAGSSTISMDQLTNPGAVATLAGAGTLRIESFSGLGSLTGNFSAAAGTTIQFGASASPGTSAGAGLTLGGGGQYQFTTGVLTLADNPIAHLEYAGGTVVLGPGFQGGAITNLTVDGSTLSNTLPVTGTLVATNGILSGSFLVADGAVLSVNGVAMEAQVTVENGGQMLLAGSSSSIGQNGYAGNTNCWLWLQSGAQMSAASSAYLYLWSPMTNSGTCYMTNEGFYVYNNNTAGQDGGLVNLAGGVINLISAAGIMGESGFDYLVNQGTINVSAGSSTISMDQLTNPGAVATLAGAGTLRIESFSGLGSLTGNFSAAAGTTIQFGASASPGTSAGAGLTLGGGGQYQFTTGVLTLADNPIAHLEYAGGTVVLGPGFQGGAITNLTVDGSSLSNTLPVTGTLVATNGTLSGSFVVASGAVLSVNGVAMEAQVTVKNGGQMLLAGSSSDLGQNGYAGNTNCWLWLQSGAQMSAASSAYLYLWSPMTNSGTCSMTNEGFYVYNNNTAGQDGGLVNLAGGVINLISAAGIMGESGFDYLVNQGTISAFSTNNTSTISVDNFTNAATLSAQHGTLRLGGAHLSLESSETLSVGLNSSTDFGTFAWNESTALDLAQAGTLLVTLNGGYVPAVSNSFTILTYAAESGAFANVSLPTEGLSWQLNYGASSLILLATNYAAPNVSITSPTNGEGFVVPVNITINATSTDTNAAVVKVEFFQGTNKLGQSLSSPYSFTWNNVVPGFYSLTAKATDAAGATAISIPVSISVYSNIHPGTNFFWVGGVSSDWFTPGNWNPAGVPSLYDTVNVTNGGTATLTNSASVAFLNLSSGTVNGIGGLTVYSNFNFTGGTVGCPTSLASNAVLNINGSGTVYLDNPLTNAGTVNWLGGTVYVFNNTNTPYAGAVENLAGALWDIQCDQSMINFYSTTNAYFHNLGTLQKSAATGTTTISVALDNAGTVAANQGMLNFEGGGTMEGAFSAASGAEINFSGGAFRYGTPPTLTGPGTIEFTGGTLTLLDNTIPNLQMTGGTVSLGANFQGGAITNLTLGAVALAGNYTVSGLLNCGGGVSGALQVLSGGTFNWSGGTISGSVSEAAGALVNWTGGTANGPLAIASNAVLNINGGGTVYLENPLTNAGTVNWLGGTVYVFNNTNTPYAGAVENLAGAVWGIQCDQSMINFYSTTNAYFHNVGTLEKSASTGTTSISVSCVNAGDLEILTGVIDFSMANGYAQTGATLDFGIGGAGQPAPLIVNGNLSLDGTLDVSLLNGYMPNAGDAIPLISCGALTNAFDSLNLPLPGNNLGWLLNYAAGGVSLTAISTGGATAQITGSVTNNQGAPVTNITVFAILTNLNTSIYLSTVTDAGGNYVLNVTNGVWTVGVQGLVARGYNTVPAQQVVVNNSNQTANFAVQPFTSQSYTITVTASPPGGGSAAGGGVFLAGSLITLTASANTSTLPYSFSTWTENGVFQSANATYAFTATRDRDLVANFVLPVFSIAVSNNPPGAGTVVGAGSFSYGTTNVLTAYPGFGYSFSNWTEGAVIVGTSPALTSVIFASHTFVANYAAANLIHVVTTATSPPGLALVAGAGTYTNGQTASFSAPLLVTNAPDVFTFQQFALSNTPASFADPFTKTLSTLDPTNLEYVAVYAGKSILPILASVSVNYSPLVPSTTNFVVRLQFDRSMQTNVSPLVVLTNSAAAIQPAVPAGGFWSATVLNNDTYSTPPVTIAPGMDGIMQLYVSGAQDTNGNTMALTNAAQFTVEATPPPNPLLTLVASNSSSITVGWSSYNAPADLAGFHVYLQTTNYTSAAGLPILTGLGSAARSWQFNGLSLDTPYYAAVQAVDTAGNSLSTLTPLEIILPSSLPPAVSIAVSSVGASSALVSWNGYSTAGLLGFAGFYVYYQQANFTSAAGLTPQATLGPTQTSFQVNGLDRTKTNYFAVVGFNAANNFNPNVSTEAWTDPYAGTLSVNTTIGGSAPVVVPIYQSMVVVSNATLTIQPGTTLLFAPGTSLTVAQGSLAANGTGLAPIIFDSAKDVSGGLPAPGDWGGVTLGSGAGSSSLQFVEILYGTGLTINGCAPSVQALTANFNTPSGLLLENGATLTTVSALFSGNQTGVRQSDTAALNLEGSVIQNNQTNAWAAGGAVLNASSNWWGTAAQGSLTPLLAGNVSYSPFLSYEPVLTPAIGASNGVTQVGARSVVLQLACRTATAMRLSEDFTFSNVFFTAFSNYTVFPLSAGAGFKHIFAQFRSVTGETNSPVEVDVNYITAGPVIQSFSLSEGETLHRPVTVTGSATAVLGMQDIEFYVDGAGVATNTGGSFSCYFDVRPLNNAVHQVELLARDAAGNIATLEEDVVVAVTPPLAPVIAMPASNYVTNNDNISIAGTAEANIGIQVTDSGQVLGTTTADSSGYFSLSNVTLTEGVNPIIAVASDSTGQTSSQARQVTVETIPPAALVMNKPVYVPGTGINLAWQFAPPGKQAATFQLFWANAPFSTVSQATGHSISLTAMSYTAQGLANGTYYFGVVGYDAAGQPQPAFQPGLDCL